MDDNAHERDREQDGYGQAPVSRRSFVIGVAAAGAAATAARRLPGRPAVPGAAGGEADRAAASLCGSLSLVPGPGSGGELTDAAFVSADEWWAVGNVGAALHANQTLIARFDGSAWSVVASPNQGTLNNGLNGVSMIPGAGWAVGYYQAGGYQPLAMSWNGTKWSLNSPAAFPSDSLFTGVDTLADGTAWAVGFQTTKAGARSTLIEHVSGGTWTPVASPNVAGTDNSLMAVSGTAATGLWAVGYWLGPMGLQPLVLRYDTTKPSPSWVLVGGVPSPGQVDTVLTGVDVRAAGDVWAVGYCNDGGADRPLALHWNGSTWTSSPVPGAGLLRTVSAVASGNVWAAGAYYNVSLQGHRTLAVHYDGTNWATVVSADSHAASDEVIGLAVNPQRSCAAKGLPLISMATIAFTRFGRRSATPQAKNPPKAWTHRIAGPILSSSSAPPGQTRSL